MTTSAPEGRRALPGSEPVPRKIMAVLNGIPGMVGYWDRELRNHLANEAYTEYFGWSPEDMLGVHMRDVLGEKVYQACLPFVRRALRGEEQLFDSTIVDVQGDERHMQTSYIPDSVGGKVHGFFVLNTDVTERVIASRDLQRSVDEYRALARSMPSGFVLLFDRDLRFSVADGVELSAFGLTQDDLEGRTLHEVFPPEVAAELEPRYRGALAGETVSWERVRGRRRFKVTAGPVIPDEGGEVVSGLVTALDITEDRRTQRTWAALHEIATDVAKHMPPALVARDIAAAVAEIFGVTTAAVARYTGPGSAEVLAIAPAMMPTLDEILTFNPGDDSAIARVAHTGRSAMVRYSPAGGSIAEQLTAGGITVGAAAPIHSHGEVWGAIAIASEDPEGIDQNLVDELDRFATLVELAVGNTSAWDTLLHEAGTDELTGLPNRRSFNQHLHREVERAARYHREVSVALMDMDHFKSVNDRFGHPVGDRVLEEFGRRARAVSREGEIVARVGGEEFAWIMPEADGQTAVLAAERLRQAVSAAPFDVVGTLTVSVGVCSLRDAGGPMDVVSCADDALYKAKRAGRDQVARFERQPG